MLAPPLGPKLLPDITRAQFAAVSLKLYEAMSGKKAPAASENPFTDTTDPVILQSPARSRKRPGRRSGTRDRRLRSSARGSLHPK
mgnify:CR=1 FL=1